MSRLTLRTKYRSFQSTRHFLCNEPYTNTILANGSHRTPGRQLSLSLSPLSQLSLSRSLPAYECTPQAPRKLASLFFSPLLLSLCRACGVVVLTLQNTKYPTSLCRWPFSADSCKNDYFKRTVGPCFPAAHKRLERCLLSTPLLLPRQYAASPPVLSIRLGTLSAMLTGGTPWDLMSPPQSLPVFFSVGPMRRPNASAAE